MRLCLTIPITFCFLFFMMNGFSQQIPEKTLLWRIEGKNITAPSYIYGTMHLYDQRLFNFGDSVYHALEASEGFANEIDPVIFLDSMFAENRKDTSPLLKDIVEEKKYNEIAKKLKEKLGLDADELTTKKIAGKRSAWYYNQRNKDDMNAIVDFYLYDVARKQGKITGGIEDYSDQKDLFDEVGNAIDIEAFSNENPASWKKNLNKFIDVYLDQDVETIYQLSSSSKLMNDSKKILDNRNIKMASNIDSIIHIRSNFFAVGAAHLAGEKGLINLMRAKGYLMVPVFSSQKKHAKKYVYDAVPIIWESVTSDDDSYSVEMPGKASDLKISDEVPPFKMYADLGSNIFYMTTSMPAVGMEKDPLDILNKGVQRFVEGTQHKQLSSRTFLYNGDHAAEVVSVKDGVFFRMNLVLQDSRVYVLVLGAQKKNLLLTADADRFLKSLKTDRSFKEKVTAWHHFTNAGMAVELDFPVMPKFTPGELNETTATAWEVFTHSASDLTTGGYYSLISLSTAPGYLITDDTTVLKSKIDVFAAKDFTILEQEYFNWDGYPAMKYTGKIKDEGMVYFLDVVTVNRVNRNVTAMAVVPDNEKAILDAQKFIKSFKLLQFDTAAWQTRMLPDATASTWGPAEFRSQPGDSSKDSDAERVDFMIDRNSSVNYTVNVTGYHPYFFRPDEDSLLQETAATFYSDTSAAFRETYNEPIDSLIYSKKIKNGTATGMEVLVKQPASHHYKKIRFFINGDSLYKLIVFAPLKELENPNTHKFFDDFRFSKPNTPGGLFTNHNEKIISDLSSTDSSIRQQAKLALDDNSFSKEELPLLHRTLLQYFPYDTASYYRIGDIIKDKLSEMKDPSTTAFIEQEYKNVAVSVDRRAADMLEILAENKTAASYSLLKKLWLEIPPQSTGLYSFGSHLTDSLQLAATLFPDFQVLYSDTITGGTVIKTAAGLIDSFPAMKGNLLSNSDGIIAQSNWQLSNYYKENYYNYDTYSLLKLLASLNTTESLSLLHDFTKQPEIYISMGAVNSLLSLGVLPEKAVLDKLAADNNQRISLYEALQRAGKVKSFPEKYNNQVSFALSQLCSLADEEDIYPDSTMLLNTHKVKGKNGTELYYSFKVTDSEGENYLGFIGPYKTKELLVPFGNLTYQFLYNTSYTKDVVNNAFISFLENIPKE